MRGARPSTSAGWRLGDYLDRRVATVCVQLFQRGRTADAEALVRCAAGRGWRPAAQAEDAASRAVAAAIAAQRWPAGAEAAAALERAAPSSCRPTRTTAMQVINLSRPGSRRWSSRSSSARPFEQVADRVRGARRAAAAIRAQRTGVYFVYGALGRLAQCRRARAERRQRRRRGRRGARSRRLRQDRHTDPAGAPPGGPRRPRWRSPAGRAMRSGPLAEAEPELTRLDAPLIAYEAARVRARALTALGTPGDADRQATVALAIAVEQQLAAPGPLDPQRVRRCCDPSRRATTAGPATPATACSRSRWAVGTGDVHRRRLDALQQVSLAAATVLDPRRAGPGRAGRDDPHLRRRARVPVPARPTRATSSCRTSAATPTGADLDELTGYSSTPRRPGARHRARRWWSPAARRARRWARRAPWCTACAASWSRRCSSRAACSAWSTWTAGSPRASSPPTTSTSSTAITNHIAVSLETARAAQLEVAVQAARQQRDLAESCAAAMADDQRHARSGRGAAPAAARRCPALLDADAAWLLHPRTRTA